MLEAIFVLLATLGSDTTKNGGNEVVDFAKTLDVSSLDAALKRQPLEQWFAATTGPGVELLEWSNIVCGQLKRPQPETHICVRGHAKWREGRATIVAVVDIDVGTRAQGVTGVSVVDDVNVRVVPKLYGSDAEYMEIQGSSHSKSLSDLPGMIERARARTRLPQ